MSNYAPKLEPGDEVRVVAPAVSYAKMTIEQDLIAKLILSEFGLSVTIAQNATSIDSLGYSASPTQRAADINQAFADPAVKMILAAKGGFNSNQILNYLDYDLIRANPKLFCGYSDITAISNAIYAKTGLVTYSGPNYSSLDESRTPETLEYFIKCMFNSDPYSLEPPQRWFDAGWQDDAANQIGFGDTDFWTIHDGRAEGTIVGGNLCTLNLLQGTEFMPDLVDAILFLEDDHESQYQHFDRNLQSLLHQPGIDQVRGVVIGRFQRDSHMDSDKLTYLIQSKPELKGKPVVANVPFGHTSPKITFPIGGRCLLEVSESEQKLVIQTY